MDVVYQILCPSKPGQIKDCKKKINNVASLLKIELAIEGENFERKENYKSLLSHYLNRAVTSFDEKNYQEAASDLDRLTRSHYGAQKVSTELEQHERRVRAAAVRAAGCVRQIG